jgi:type VI secretion system protein ImpF
VSGERRGPVGRRDRPELRAQLSVLDRLLDDTPDEATERAPSAGEAMHMLRRAVRRDLQALLNARRPWRSVPDAFPDLVTSPLGFGLPDYGSGAFGDPIQREALRAEVEATIRRFEPRFLSLTVELVNAEDSLTGTLRLRIKAELDADPEPEPIGYDTLLDAAKDQVVVRESAPT